MRCEICDFNPNVYSIFNDSIPSDREELTTRQIVLYEERSICTECLNIIMESLDEFEPTPEGGG